MITLTPEQKQAYDRFIKARDRVNLFKSNKYEYVPMRDYLESYKDDGQLTPLFEPNDLWNEYKQAFTEWLAVEPKFREQERMRMSRGDYGKSDSWDEPEIKIKDVVQLTGGK